MKFSDLFKNFKFKITLPWFGESKMKKAMPKDKKITNKEICEEIKKSI